ncbi:hypothetical protein ROA7450_03805 [Roseovarius albus]|uniref:Uncharacterized protein n=1 Tax=Roseovarius albus TaxID=1247867 RepID=A0A1X7A3Y1_9RHOB|nr:hypothetical protein ROA7450_03805 [Roseovarius albus]
MRAIPQPGYQRLPRDEFNTLAVEQALSYLKLLRDQPVNHRVLEFLEK